jgi:transcription elongation factor Elf1
MPVRVKVRASLIQCGRCGKPYRNPLTHQCVSRMGRKSGRSRVKPKLQVALIKCGKCGQSYSNPLTHTCTTKTDFKKRLAEAKKAARPKPEKHEPEDCTDDDCPRYGCVCFRKGRAVGYSGGDRDGVDGLTEGYLRGYGAGFGEGYDKGFPDGVAACPREHK